MKKQIFFVLLIHFACLGFANERTQIYKLNSDADAQQMLKAITPHMSKNAKISTYKNQIIITAEPENLEQITKILVKLKKQLGVYRLSFLNTKFALKPNTFSNTTTNKIKTLSVYTHKHANMNSQVILPVTKIGKNGSVNKEFKTFDSKVSVNLIPMNNDFVIVNFSLNNIDDISKSKQFNNQNIVSSYKAKLGFWQLVGSNQGTYESKKSVKYSSNNANYFYICVEKAQKKSNCTVK